jgi:hypothetical protein
MPQIRLLTIDLLSLLADLLHTAGTEPGAAGCYGILLHSDRGYSNGSEPGQVGLLVGTSSNGQAVGHTWTEAAGVLPPMLWPSNDVRAVIAAFRPLTKDNKEHVAEIRFTDNTISVTEDPDLFGNGLTVSFGAGNLDDFPRSAWAVLTDVRVTPPDGSPVQTRTDFGPKVMAPFLAVAKSRNSFVQMYRYHQRQAVLVQIGQHYRGALSPSSWDEIGGNGAEPDAEIYPADLPALPDAETELVTAGDGGETNG